MGITEIISWASLAFFTATTIYFGLSWWSTIRDSKVAKEQAERFKELFPGSKQTTRLLKEACWFRREEIKRAVLFVVSVVAFFLFTKAIGVF